MHLVGANANVANRAAASTTPAIASAPVFVLMYLLFDIASVYVSIEKALAGLCEVTGIVTNLSQ
jgi:hypothetical protein